MPCRRLILLLAASLPLGALAQRPPVLVPDDPDFVVEELPKGYAALMPRADADNGTGNPASLETIQQMLATAGSTGDARLVARAEAALARRPTDAANPAALRARAYATQYRHDFQGALALLDEAIRANPRDGGARLARAQILVVQGDLQRARSECAALALGVDVNAGLICVAAVAQRRGEFKQAKSLLDRGLQRTGIEPDMRRYLLVARAEVASRAGDGDADTWFGKALALAPDDVRTLAAYVRHLRADGRPLEAFKLLGDGVLSDHLQVQQALAAHEAGLSQAAALADAISRRDALVRQLGSEPDLRDEAWFQLVVRGDADAALRLAQRNFVDQRDVEDVTLLRRAATAAKEPAALEPLNAWAKAQQLELAPLPGTDGDGR